MHKGSGSLHSVMINTFDNFTAIASNETTPKIAVQSNCILVREKLFAKILITEETVRENSRAIIEDAQNRSEWAPNTVRQYFNNPTAYVRILFKVEQVVSRYKFDETYELG